MSLLECICCRRHRLRTAVIWDDLELLPSVQTYSFLLQRACKVACYLRRILTESKNHGHAGGHAWGERVPRIGIYGSCSPEVISGLLGVLAIPGAYVPVDVSQPVAVQRELVRKASIALLLVHHSSLEDFLQRDWGSGSVSIHSDSTLLELGFVVAANAPGTADRIRDEAGERPPGCAQILSLTVGENSVGTLATNEGCSTTSMCNSCTRFCQELSLLHPEPSRPEEELLSSYLSEVQVPCHLCCQLRSPSTRSSLGVASDLESPAHCESPAPWSLPSVPPILPAYVIHTSGTTGLPKGVCVPHCCVVPNITDLRERFSICRDDVIFNAAPLTFDPSVVELMLALSCGAALLTTLPRVRSSPSRLASLLFHRQRVSVMQVTPALVYRFPERVIRRDLLGERSPVRVLAFGGESCPALGLLARWKDPHNTTTLFNIYGITEVSSWAACYQISGDDLWHSMSGSDSQPVTSSQSRLPLETTESQDGKEFSGQVPIGEPLLGTRLEVRSSDGARVSCGCGEIWIGGSYRVCLLEGERDLVPGRMRPSGDWGHLSPDGGLYYVCRTDRQIKRAGHRINLDGIQQTIHTLEEVSTCAVTSLTSAELRRLPLPKPPHVVHPSHQRSQRTDSEVFLVAFIVPRDPQGSVAAGSADVHRLALALKRKMFGLLPGYSIPDEVVLVKHLPTTEHGKVDLKALADCPSPDVFLAVDVATESAMTAHPGKTLRPPDWVEIKSLLRSVARRLLGLAEWPNDECLLDLGANSFDVVRVSNQFDLELENSFPVGSSSDVNQSPAVPTLVEILLSESLDHAALHVAREISDRVAGVSSEPAVTVSGGAATAEDSSKIGSLVSRKRRRNIGEGRHGSGEQAFGKKSREPTAGSHEPNAGSHELTTGSHEPTTGSHEPTVGSHEPTAGSHEPTAGSHEPTTGGVGGGLPYRAWRRGQYFINGRLQPNAVTRTALDSSPHLLSSKPATCTFSIKWSINTGQCVDASPLVVRWGDSPALVFTGSHSGLLLAAWLRSGEELWRAQLSDRIESSACVSPCGRYIVVGCYDGCVYALHTGTGAVHWCFQPSQEPVKSSPCVDSTNGLVWFGSHDQNLYAIDVKKRVLVHRLFLGGGACFSSPSISSEAGTLYCATLQGRLVAVDLASAATVKWMFQCPKPVFSSPALLPPGGVVVEGVAIGGVAVGCVDGCVYFIGEDGKLVAKADTVKPVFSSCCVTELVDGSSLGPSIPAQGSVKNEINSEEGRIKRSRHECETQWRVFSGSHDRAIYCWNERLELEWRIEMDSEVYSTPCLFHLKIPFPKQGPRNPYSQSDSDDSSVTPSCTELPCLCACSTAGFIYIVELFAGTVIGSHELPWDVFSSPVVVDNCIVVGCRDDRVYCVEAALAELR